MLGAAVFLTLWMLTEISRITVGGVLVLVLFSVAIAVSGFVPIASLALIVAIPALQLLGILYPPSPTDWPIYQAIGFVALVIGFRGEGLVRKLVLPVGVASALLIASRMMVPSWQEGYWTDWIGRQYIFSDYPHRENFLTLLLMALGFYIGMWALGLAGRSLLRERAIGGVLVEAEDRLKNTDFELRLSQDRARISRDVHDALAHSLAVIVSQAEGAIALGEKKPRVRVDALRNIATVGRTALVDVRSLVERITSSEEDESIATPRPTIADLGSVVAHLEDLGMDVSLREIGERGLLAPSHELAVFRIVQESLTNALKHAGRTSVARVTLDWQGPGLAVLVTSSSPSGETLPTSTARGVGIEGMKERARLTGGWLTAGASGDGIFIVTAFIPALQVVAPAPAEELADA